MQGKKNKNIVKDSHILPLQEGSRKHRSTGALLAKDQGERPVLTLTKILGTLDMFPQLQMVIKMSMSQGRDTRVK